MLGFIQFLNTPTKLAFVIVLVFLIMQIIGELLEFKGKVVPEIFKIRKYFANRKQYKEMIRHIPEMIEENRKLFEEERKFLQDVEKHYNADNIKMRNNWIESVNKKLDCNDSLIKKLDKKIDKNNENILSMKIDNMKSELISFASYVSDLNNPVTREQFNRFFATHDSYEKILEEHKLTNGETDVAFRIAVESYEEHLKHHSFLEDIRGYN